jgi:hypothetical protein
MTIKNYAFIKSNQVINVVVFENLTSETMAHFKQEFQLDDIILATEKTVLGGTYDGTQFWLPQPYPSWVKSNGEWVAPKTKPDDGLNYSWSEDAVDWVLINP